jgi:hypothetical protein
MRTTKSQKGSNNILYLQEQVAGEMIVRLLSFSALPFLLLTVSIPIAVSISNILPQQQAKAQRASTTTNSTTTSTQQPKNAFLTYTNSTYGIKIQYHLIGYIKKVMQVTTRCKLSSLLTHPA